MAQFKLLLLPVLACCGVWSAPAQEAQANELQSVPAQSLSLDEAVQTAERQHPALKAAQAAVDAAEAEVRVARSAYFPQLSVSGIAKLGLAGATGALGLPGFPASPFYRNTAYSLNWYQSIFDFGRIKHLVAMKRALYDGAQLRQRSDEQRIVFEVKRAYFSALEAQRLEQLGESTVTLRSLTVGRARAYRQAELESQLDLSLAEASLAEAQGSLSHARNAVLLSFAALRAAMGETGSATHVLVTPSFETISLPSLEELVRVGMQNRPDEEALRFKVTALRERLGLTRSDNLPDIRGFAAAGEGRFSGTTVPENQRHGVAGLGAIIPLFTGGRLRAARDEARAELEGAMAVEDELGQQIRLEVAEAYYQISDLAARLDASYQQQQSAREALSLARARYAAELGSFLDVLTAQVMATRAETDYARMRFAYERAKAQLDFATGRPMLP